MFKHLILHLFSNRSSIVILIGLNLLGCAGTTTLQRQHHLLLKDSSKASVYFLRPKEGLGGGWAAPIGIKLDGENLLDLSVGQYTLLDIRPGKYEMVVTSWTDGPENTRVQTSRIFVIDFEENDYVYLRFSLEKIDFWDKFFKTLADRVDPIIIPLGKYVSLNLTSKSKPQPGIGYTVESVSRETAIEVASKLDPVEGAQNSPLHK